MVGLVEGVGFVSTLVAASLGESGFEGVGASVFVAASTLDDSGTALFSAAGLVGCADFVDVESGRARDEEMMAGSTGAPGTVGWELGGRRAGGVYLFAPPLARGRYTPLYLVKSQHMEVELPRKYIQIFFISILVSGDRILTSLFANVCVESGASFNFPCLLLCEGGSFGVLWMAAINGRCVQVLVIVTSDPKEPLVCSKLIPCS